MFIDYEVFRLRTDALLARIEEACRAAGIRKLVSRIFPENTGSLALCRAVGFREVGTYRRHGMLDGVWRVAAHALDERARAIVQRDALAVAAHLLPQTRAYYELWLDEQPVATADTEPVYGDTYLPRKFKIGFALPPANDVDVFANDLGFIAIVEDGQVVGYNVSAGGGLGTTHGDARTYPRTHLRQRPRRGARDPSACGEKRTTV